MSSKYLIPSFSRKRLGSPSSANGEEKRRRNSPGIDLEGIGIDFMDIDEYKVLVKDCDFKLIYPGQTKGSAVMNCEIMYRYENGLDTKMYKVIPMNMSGIERSTFEIIGEYLVKADNGKDYTVDETDPYKSGRPLYIFKLKDERGVIYYGGKTRRTKLDSRTVKELQELCAKKKIKYSGLRKAELVAALRK